MTIERWAVLATVDGPALAELRARLEGASFAYLLVGPVPEAARAALAETLMAPPCGKAVRPDPGRLLPARRKGRVAEADLLQRQLTYLAQALELMLGPEGTLELWRGVEARMDGERPGQ